MKSFKRSINKQIESNQGKNIFGDNPEIFKFINETIQAISKVNELNHDSEQFLIDYATDKALEEFCRINQFYSFDSNSKRELRKIYADLFKIIRSNSNSVEDISKNHYQNLKNWLRESNPFAEEVYINKGDEIKAIVCSEYSPNLQIDILHINIENLMQPILDIGCGSQAKFVKHIENLNIEVHGIDRFKFTSPNLTTVDWLEYNYGVEKWGTIISNLGFSNHFNHHNLRKDGNYINYAKIYMNILYSLKIGGSFHYAPALPFIEKYLDSNQFSITKHEVKESDFKTTIIKRLK